jgi:hypothetical protein
MCGEEGGGGLTDVGAVDEAEEIEETNGRNDHPVNLSTKSSFCLRINVELRILNAKIVS